MRLALDGPSPGGTPAGDRLWRDASSAVDAVRGRFGDAAVGPATLVGPGGLGVKQPGATQWGPSEADDAPSGPVGGETGRQMK